MIIQNFLYSIISFKRDLCSKIAELSKWSYTTYICIILIVWMYVQLPHNHTTPISAYCHTTLSQTCISVQVIEDPAQENLPTQYQGGAVSSDFALMATKALFLDPENFKIHFTKRCKLSQLQQCSMIYKTVLKTTTLPYWCINRRISLIGAYFLLSA